ncbi:MAG TPA: L,D-transpeptidase [Pseudonocardia sp.]|jgi:hypothetical protein
METSTARRGGPRRRGIRSLAVVGSIVAASTVSFSGTALAAVGGGAAHPVPMASGPLVPGTPCHVGTAACVQLGHQGFNAKSWLIRDDRVVRGPVSSATGGPGMDTDPGTYAVTSKDRDHVSSETTNAEGAPSEMPYSVFFGNSGYAFHGGGDPAKRTAGCVRLANPDASYWYNNLNTGDQVEVVTSDAPVAGGGGGGGSYNDNDNDDRGSGLLGGL